MPGEVRWERGGLKGTERVDVMKTQRNAQEHIGGTLVTSPSVPRRGGQLAGAESWQGPKAGSAQCDRGSVERGLGESRHNNADGRGWSPDLITATTHLPIENYTADIDGRLSTVLNPPTEFPAVSRRDLKVALGSETGGIGAMAAGGPQRLSGARRK